MGCFRPRPKVRGVVLYGSLHRRQRRSFRPRPKVRGVVLSMDEINDALDEFQTPSQSTGCSSMEKMVKIIKKFVSDPVPKYGV